jgi:hypothetical protein
VNLTRLPLAADGSIRRAVAAGCALFTGCEFAAVHGQLTATTADAEEALVVVLSGTFDLQAGPSHWGQRGARSEPRAGRPLGVFLPPRTPLSASHGDGELLLVRARQALLAPPATGRQALSQKPLLPLAGSGKAFDPAAGEWLPAETFPTAPELIPPRRAERRELAGVTIERIFPPAYKAATLSLDEVVLLPQATLALAQLQVPAGCRELLLAIRGAGVALHLVDADGAARREVIDGDAVFAGTLPADLSLQAGPGGGYAVFSWAGK